MNGVVGAIMLFGGIFFGFYVFWLYVLSDKYQPDKGPEKEMRDKHQTQSDAF
jgi:hypothetical protein